MKATNKYVIYLPSDGGLLTSIATTFVVLAAAVWFYDIVYYLQTGTFHLLSALFAIKHLSLFYSWVYYPQSWLGLHSFLAKAPLSFALLFIGLLVAAYDYHNSNT
jgi:hypothetical protein